MSLESGSRIGCYEVIAILGAGGMGEVYRARDTKLGRDVALKVLPEVFAADAERLARFTREAQLLASLNHANIGVIHGIEDTSGVRALVLELVEGDTLADRIRRGPLTVDETVHVGRQIAEALEAAHERGVIHRDLKPANVKITPDGKVKVLDFGLAKAMDSAPSSPHVSHSPTLSLAGTVAGMVLGTAAYMSPEQAKGLPADQRSDVFSFGCVMFEMLVARQVFQADSAAESLAAVLMRSPDLAALPPQVPPRLRALVQRCLEKDPKRRWQAVGDVRYELEAIASDPNPLVAPAIPVPAAVAPNWRRAIPVAVVALLSAVAASAVTLWWGRGAIRPSTVTRFQIPVETDVATPLRTNAGVLAISPDGTRLVYAANRQLYLRSMADVDVRPIPGTNLDVLHPFFSPDGQWIAFFAMQDLTLKKIAVTGGAALTLCKVEAGAAVGGASWDGGQIVFALPGKGIMRVSADGGVPEVIAAVDVSSTPFGPQLIDDGRAVLFTVTNESGVERWDKADIVVQPIGSTQRKVVVRGGSDGRYLPTGHLVYALGGTILAVPFDRSKRQATGGPVPLVEGVRRPGNAAVAGGLAQFVTSADGSLAYLPGTVATVMAPKTLAFADRTGKLVLLGLPAQPYVHPRLSPDGTELVVATDDGKEGTLWVYDIKAGGVPRRLTFGGRNRFPIWSPDGRFIAFQSDREGDLAIFRVPADGSGAPERLTKPDQGSQHEPESWRPDGKALSLNLVRGVSQGVWIWPFDGDRKPVMFVDAPGEVEKHSAFSPDGKWIAYLLAALAGTSGATTGVFVEPYPRTGAKYQVAPGGGRTPLWSRDGRELFFHDQFSNRLSVVSVRTEPTFSSGTPVVLPIEGTVHPIQQRNYDVTPDGKQLLVVLPESAGKTTQPSAQQINVVLNWAEELKARVPVK
jgi:Tol biopolymer transport system component